MRSTMMCVFLVLASLNSSISASLAVALLDRIGLFLCFQGVVVVAVVIVSVVMMVTIELFFAFTFVVLLTMVTTVMVMMALMMIRGWLLPD